MSKALIFVLLALAILLFANDVSCQLTEPTFRYAYCLGDTFGNYTTNSTYESNLKTVVSTLDEHASTMSFYNTSAGNGTDTVYGQYYCRGDVDSDFCKNCIHAATLHALNCSNAKGAIIWHNECTLRYENASLYGIELERFLLRSWSTINHTDPENLFIAFNDTMIKLIDEVKAGYEDMSMISPYATGQGKVSAFETVYCLVQCSPDMNADQCDTCLRDAYDYLQTCCGQYPTRIYVFYESCQVMYNLNPFYISRNAPPPPRPSSPPPPSPFLDFAPPPPPSDDTVSAFRPPPPPPPANGASPLLVKMSLKLGIIITTAVAFYMLMFA